MICLEVSIGDSTPHGFPDRWGAKYVYGHDGYPAAGGVPGAWRRNGGYASRAAIERFQAKSLARITENIFALDVDCLWQGNLFYINI
ncbi:hypothetical protein [Komagataeibacter xylinus]|uniref:hypothetical protein n=1 Tax=Komagataeibacter xylinus TaxID=28448 RepID=UPI00280B50AD|nr:hypothetical protein [Komagataeibacter xylinus]